MENTTIAILGKPAEEEQLDWVEQLHPITGGSQHGKSRLAEALFAQDGHYSEQTGGLNNE